MELLNADAILAHAGTLPTKVVNVPAWGGAVKVRGMTIKEFELNQARLGSDDGKATAALVARCVVDDSGRRVFTDAHIDRIAELGFAEVNRIGQAISELSGLTEESREELAGNSDAAPSGEPSSESPAISDAPSPTLQSV